MRRGWGGVSSFWAFLLLRVATLSLRSWRAEAVLLVDSDTGKG